MSFCLEMSTCFLSLQSKQSIYNQISNHCEVVPLCHLMFFPIVFHKPVSPPDTQIYEGNTDQEDKYHCNCHIGDFGFSLKRFQYSYSGWVKGDLFHSPRSRDRSHCHRE